MQDLIILIRGRIRLPLKPEMFEAMTKKDSHIQITRRTLVYRRFLDARGDGFEFWKNMYLLKIDQTVKRIFERPDCSNIRTGNV